MTDFFYCPNKTCDNNKPDLSVTNWYIRHGYHPTIAFGRVPRYRCKTCGKTFSDQTFLLNYYLKRKTDFKELFKQFNSANSDCFIARECGLSNDSIQLRRERMARNCMFFQEKILEGHNLNESLCADGFESYTASKFYPNNINILVGSDSLFLYYFTESIQRRKGQMTDGQKRKTEICYKDKSFRDSRLAKAFQELLNYIKRKTQSKSIILHTDKHRTYEGLIKGNNAKVDTGHNPEIIHHQTVSTELRTKDNPLFSVNYMDRQFRKDLPNHRRKTVCSAKNDRCMLARIATYMVSHNFFKPSSILSRSKQVKERHYYQLGLDQQKLDYWKSYLFTKRFLVSRAPLSDYFRDIWFKRTATPLKTCADYVPGFAFQ